MKDTKNTENSIVRIASKGALKACVFWMCLPFVLPLIIVAAIFVWEPDFFYIDGCLDNGGRWDYELRECEYAPEGTLAYQYVCELHNQTWEKGKGCLYSKEYADQYPEIEPYKN